MAWASNFQAPCFNAQRSATRSHRALQLLERGQQGPDHPVHPAIPETAYLKAFFLRVLPGF